MEYVIQTQPIDTFDGRYLLVKPLPVRYTTERNGIPSVEYFRMINPFNEQNFIKLYTDVKSAAQEMLLSLAEQLNDLLVLERELERKGETLPDSVQKSKRELSDFIQPVELRIVK